MTERYNGPERRSKDAPTAHRRRQTDRRENFRLRRDAALLIVGIGGVVLMALASVFIGFKDTGVAMALVATFAGFAGAPTVLRLDEQRREES